MSGKEIIKATKEYIESISSIKQEIKNIDILLNNHQRQGKERENLENIRNELENKLTRLQNAMSSLNEEEQKALCYRYFERMSQIELLEALHYSKSKLYKTINNSLFKVGKILFCIEILG